MRNIWWIIKASKKKFESCCLIVKKEEWEEKYIIMISQLMLLTSWWFSMLYRTINYMLISGNASLKVNESLIWDNIESTQRSVGRWREDLGNGIVVNSTIGERTRVS